MNLLSIYWYIMIWCMVLAWDLSTDFCCASTVLAWGLSTDSWYAYTLVHGVSLYCFAAFLSTLFSLHASTYLSFELRFRTSHSQLVYTSNFYISFSFIIPFHSTQLQVTELGIHPLDEPWPNQSCLDCLGDHSTCMGGCVGGTWQHFNVDVLAADSESQAC